jgi:hypothetical protein
MKVEKPFTVIGKKLEKEYKKLGFKYSEKNKFLKKRTKRFEYYILFSRFFECIPNIYTELRITLVITDRTLLKNNINANIEVVCMDLWEMGNHYNMANETLLNNVFIDLRKKIEEYLIPQLEKLERENG